jgi:hypothetical protein
MRKEWIRTEEECYFRKLKRLFKQQKKMNSKKKSLSDKYPVDNILYIFEKISFLFCLDLSNE